MNAPKQMKLLLTPASANMVILSASTANIKKCKSSFWIVYFLFAFVLTQTISSLAQTPVYNYTVQGVLEQKSLRYSQEKKSFYYDFSTYGFEAYVSNCCWSIKLGTVDPKVYDYRIVSSDGADTYLLLNYETRLRLNAAKGLPVNNIGDNIGDGTVAKGNMPCFAIADEAGAVWIAYASGYHFGEKVDDKRRSVPFANYVTPRTIMPGAPLAIENTSLMLNEKPPYVPKSINYWIDDLLKAGYRGKISTTFNGSTRFTNVFYKTLSFTNVEGLFLPSEALVSIYRPNTSLLPDVVTQLCQEIHLVATNIVHGVSQISFQPQLPGKTIINEERFNNGTGLNFAYWQTDHWPSENVAKASPAYEQAKMTALANATIRVEEKSPLLARVLIVVALLALPLVFFLFRRKVN